MRRGGRSRWRASVEQRRRRPAPRRDRRRRPVTQSSYVWPDAPPPGCRTGARAAGGRLLLRTLLSEDGERRGQLGERPRVVRRADRLRLVEPGDGEVERDRPVLLRSGVSTSSLIVIRRSWWSCSPVQMSTPALLTALATAPCSSPPMPAGRPAIAFRPVPPVLERSLSRSLTRPGRSTSALRWTTCSPVERLDALVLDVRDPAARVDAERAEVAGQRRPWTRRSAGRAA